MERTELAVNGRLLPVAEQGIPLVAAAGGIERVVAAGGIEGVDSSPEEGRQGPAMQEKRAVDGCRAEETAANFPIAGTDSVVEAAIDILEVGGSV